MCAIGARFHTTPLIAPVAHDLVKGMPGATLASALSYVDMHRPFHTAVSEMQTALIPLPGAQRERRRVSLHAQGHGGVFYLTNLDGSARRCEAGDTVVLPKGWSGRWDIVEPMTTVWVEVA